MYYMKNDTGNAFRHVRADEKRQELLRNGWQDVEESAVTDDKRNTKAKNKAAASNAAAPIKAKNTYQRRVSGAPKGKTITV